MIRFSLSCLAALLILPGNTFATSPLLRRASPSTNHQRRQLKDATTLPEDAVALETLQALLIEEGEQRLLSQLMGHHGSLFSMSMPSTPLPNLPTCQSAYAYCGQGASTCSLEGGWVINFAAMDLGSDFRLECELRLGSGRCIEGSDFEVSPDAPVGTFEITEEMLHPAIVSGLNVGIVDNIRMEVSNGGPVRRLSSLEGHVDEMLGQANHLYKDHQDEVLGQVEHLYQEHQDELLGEAKDLYQEHQDELMEQTKHLYHDLVLKFEDYDIVFGGELSQEHIAFYATVCKCEGENCDWTHNPDTGSVPPNETIEPSSMVVPLLDTASPSSAPSASLEPSASPSLSLPTATPTAASTSAVPPNSNNGAITNNGDNTDVDETLRASGSLSLGSLFAIIAGCVAAVLAVIVLVVRRKKNNAGDSESSANSIGSDDNISP